MILDNWLKSLTLLDQRESLVLSLNYFLRNRFKLLNIMSGL